MHQGGTVRVSDPANADFPGKGSEEIASEGIDGGARFSVTDVPLR